MIEEQYQQLQKYMEMAQDEKRLVWAHECLQDVLNNSVLSDEQKEAVALTIQIIEADLNTLSLCLMELEQIH